MNYKEYGVNEQKSLAAQRTMKKVSRLYFRSERLILGSIKTQKGGFFPIAAALAPLARKVIWKIFGRGKKRAN